MQSARYVCILLLSGTFAASLACVEGQSPPPAEGGEGANLGTLTAEELFNEGTLAYTVGRFQDAAAAFERFLASYGESADAAEILPNLLPSLALSRLRLGDYGKAQEAIGRALELRDRIPGEVREELQFWKGVCALQTEDFDRSRSELAAFARTYPRSAKRLEAEILAGTSHVIEKSWDAAVVALDPLLDRTRGEDRSRIVILRLYALSQAGRHDEARETILAEFPNLDAITQLAAFNVIVLETGAHFLEAGEFRKAVSCLQRVQDSAQLLQRQHALLDKLRAARAAAEQRNDAFATYRLGQLLAKVEREIAEFRKIDMFDSALRMRLASAYLGLNRWREAALILGAMLEELPADEIVEAASLSLLQCWNEIERWPRVVESADRFLRRFKDSARRPLALFMKGQALQEDNQAAESVEVFELLEADHPDHELAPRAAFMAGFGHLLAEDYEAGRERMEKVRADYPSHEMAENAEYWSAMALSFAKEHEPAAAAFREYCTRHRVGGRYLAEAAFREAYSMHALQDYTRGIALLEDYLRQFSGHEQNDEALLLLGDGLGAVGRVDDAIAAYRRVSDATVRFHEEAVFKAAKAMQLAERSEEVRNHLEQFVAANPASVRLAEAIHLIGRTWIAEDRLDTARDLYWQAIDRLGNDPSRRSVEDLLAGVIRLYREDDERRRLIARLNDGIDAAEESGETVRQSRLLWALARTLAREELDKATDFVRKAGALADVSTANPMLLADAAGAARAAGDLEEAQLLYGELVRWNPRAPQKAEALAALGLMAMEAGDDPAALAHFERFARETQGSLHASQVRLAHAELLARRGETDAAVDVLEALLADEYAPARKKSRALVRIGDLFSRKGEENKAFAYYQRVYVMYGRWTEDVARAYLRCGEILEARNDAGGAHATYKEMLLRADVAATPEGEEARRRLESLPAPPKTQGRDVGS